MIGPLNSHPYDTENASLNNAKVVSPPKMESKAAVLSLCLNLGNNPRIIGTEMGPSKAENHVIMSPITPPKELEFHAIIMVIRINIKVVTRATASIRDWENPLILFIKTGMISLVMTADIVLASEETIDNVLENNEASRRPVIPAGRNSIAIRE